MYIYVFRIKNVRIKTFMFIFHLIIFFKYFFHFIIWPFITYQNVDQNCNISSDSCLIQLDYIRSFFYFSNNLSKHDL